MKPLLLDGPMGTQLGALGHTLTAPLWSANALLDAPDAVLELHRAYADAGADVHTANSFRCQPGRHPEWHSLIDLSVQLAREAASEDSLVAGSMAPLEDCYRPDLSPVDALGTHREIAQALVNAGADLLLCETFPHTREALQAVEAATETSCETWLMLTAGPFGGLMEPLTLIRCAEEAIAMGASMVGINCTSVAQLDPFLDVLKASGLPFGVSANAGSPEEGLGWDSPADQAASAYSEHARRWVDAGARVIGSCCGTSPAHTQALRGLLDGKG